MRNITLIVIHCSAVATWQQSSAADIDRWHRERGWKYGIGYHYVVRRDGSVETGRPPEQVGAHCQGHNSHSIGICYEGGLDAQGRPADTRTQEQRTAMRRLVERLHKEYPTALIVGHRDLNPMRSARGTLCSAKKSCPCFDAAREYADLQPR